MRKILEYHAPQSIQQVLSLLGEKQKKPRILGGGSFLNLDKTGEYSLIDLKNSGLKGITKENGTIRVGAMTVISEILEHGFAAGTGNFCDKAFRSTAHAVARNQITIGGSVAALLPWFNAAGVLFLLNVEIELQGKNGKEKISFREYVEKQKEILEDKVITAVIFPEKTEGIGTFTRFSMTEIDYAPVFVTSIIKKSGETVTGAEIAVTGCVKRPVLLFEVSRMILNTALDEETLNRAGKTAQVELSGKLISHNPNFTVEYLEKIIPALVKANLQGSER